MQVEREVEKIPTMGHDHNVCLALLTCLLQQSSHQKDTASLKLFTDNRTRHTEKANNLQHMVQGLHFGLYECHIMCHKKRFPKKVVVENNLYCICSC